MVGKNASVLKWMVGGALVLAAGLLFAVTRPVTAPTPLALTPQDEILIYQAVIQSIDLPDPSGPRYILSSTDDRAAQSPPRTGDANATFLSSATQAGISAAVGNLIWVDRSEAVPRDPATKRVAQGGVLMTLCSLYIQPGRQVKTSAAYFAGPTWGAGYLYTLSWANGVWSISSKTLTWIS